MSNDEVREGLKKSKGVVGPLYPVLVKKGIIEIIDGEERKRADPA